MTPPYQYHIHGGCVLEPRQPGRVGVTICHWLRHHGVAMAFTRAGWPVDTWSRYQEGWPADKLSGPAGLAYNDVAFAE